MRSPHKKQDFLLVIPYFEAIDLPKGNPDPMNHYLTTQWGPDKTPTPIKHLLFWIGFISLLSAAVQTIFNQFGLFPGPENLLSLSWWGIKQGYLWQPFTYLFVQKAAAGITFSFLLEIFFLLYILWTIGSTLAEIVGAKSFLRFYFTCGILAGIAALLLMRLTGQYAQLAAPAAAILPVIIAWAMAFPEGEILLFFLIPMQTRWAVAGLVGAIVLVSLAQWDLPTFSLYLCATLLAYAYTAMAWKWTSPFSFTWPMDVALANAGSRVDAAFSKLWPFGKHAKDNASKIVDIRTGRPVELDDDAFMDAMLAKISRQGQSSLSGAERRRMEKISDSKMKDSSGRRW